MCVDTVHKGDNDNDDNNDNNSVCPFPHSVEMFTFLQAMINPKRDDVEI
jgi:hypothetical protein